MENKEVIRIKRFNKILTEKDTNAGSDNDIDKAKEKIDSRAELERMFSGVHPDNHNDNIVGVTMDRIEAFDMAMRNTALAETDRQFVMYTGTQGRITFEQAIRREVERYYYNIQNE